jgi:hypothetical protein
MYEYVEKEKESKSRTVANYVTQKKSKGKRNFLLVDNRAKTIIQRQLKIGNEIKQIDYVDNIMPKVKAEYPEIEVNSKRIYKKRIKAIIETMISNSRVYEFKNTNLFIKELGIRIFTIEGAKLLSKNTKFRKDGNTKVDPKFGEVINPFIKLNNNNNVEKDIYKIMMSKSTELDCEGAAGLCTVYGLIKGLGKEDYDMFRSGEKETGNLLFHGAADKKTRVEYKTNADDNLVPGDHIYMRNVDEYINLGGDIGALIGQHAFQGSGGLYPYPKGHTTLKKVEKNMQEDFKSRGLNMSKKGETKSEIDEIKNITKDIVEKSKKDGLTGDLKQLDIAKIYELINKDKQNENEKL